MPLSRLSPRSTRSTLARQASSRAKPNDSQRHIHLWAAIRKTREEIDQWQRQVDQVEGLFAKHVVPREHELTRATTSITAQLINHFENTDLEIADKSLLGLWVTDNLNSLDGHPFSDALKTRQLSEQWLQLLNSDGPVENQLARLARQKGFQSSLEGDDTQDNGVGEFASYEDEPVKQARHAESSTSAPGNKNPSGADFHVHDGTPPFDDTAANKSRKCKDDLNNTDDSVQLDETISSLENKLSIERLFRQLAKVLHPDREQDENIRAKKQTLMSECLKARQEKDINALLTLYCEHVGELPDDLNNNSHDELVGALEAQLKRLQADLRTKRFGDPIVAMIVERYSSSNQQDCERRIQNHAKSLQEEITSARELDKHLNSHDELLDALDARRALEQDRMSINEMTGY